MSIEIHHNIVSESEIKILRDYLANGQGIFDRRPGVTTRRPTQLGVPYDNDTSWPMQLVIDIISRAFGSSVDAWELEPGGVLFYDAKDCFTLHVDSGDGQDTLYKNILIPLYTEGGGSTVIFKNKWYGPRTRFARVLTGPFSERLPRKDGQFQVVDDIRKLSDISDFDITEKDLEELILKKSPNSAKPPEPRLSDYSQVEGYDPDLKFDEEFHQKWLSHIPIENLHGLTVKEVLEWKVGDVLVWDRHYIHSSGNDHQRKEGIAVFTNLVCSQQT